MQPALSLSELTISQAIADPLIAILNEADGVNDRAFAQLLESAARILGKCSKISTSEETEPRR
ncbi:hypothetical protein [Rhizobium leguminosarum]|uniref:hypothetical protein n=1 Tax=Rhizobium leguminosarum TaxID=384 RepID=UPI0019F30E3B|nr:hypothetical protein [Rhizobium leguminosarum bv. viciae]